MKLSKQERIGLMIIIAVVILALGGFLMVKPKIEELNLNKEAMLAKQTEFQQASDKAATKDPLREQIMDAYHEGAQKADMFFTEMKPYEADEMFREFLENRSYTKPGENKPEDKANVVVEFLGVTEPGISTLSTTFEKKENITYPLKEYATQGGVTLSESEQAALGRRSMLQSILGGGQTIGSTTISYTAKAISQDDFIKFADEINNFEREEHGTKVRKAMSVSNISLEYPEISKKYEKMIEDLEKEATAAGEAELRKNTGVTPSSGSTTGGNVPTPAGSSQQEASALSDFLFEWGQTLTLYTVERMQDPTPILNAQDGI